MEWIKVVEWGPPKGVRVLGLFSTGQVSTVRYWPDYAGEKWDYDIPGSAATISGPYITHWMPLELPSVKP